MNKTGWLVNDCLTCIPGTKTFWHDLLENIPGLIDKTNGFTHFSLLDKKIEDDFSKSKNKPDYIIRNATYFPKININCKIISLLQDHFDDDLRKLQIDVCNNSDLVIFNSPFIEKKYKKEIKSKTANIFVGTDFDFFDKENTHEELDILENSILFIGDSTKYPKGFDILLDIIKNSNFNFCLVMKDDFFFYHPRVKIFNKVDHHKLKNIINACKILLCTSRIETLHLAGIEAGACNLPLVGYNTGIYNYLYENDISGWGEIVNTENSSEYIEKIEKVLNEQFSYSPRKILLEQGLDKKTCINKWKEIINNL